MRPHRLELALELDVALATAEVDGRAAVQAADTVAERAEAAGDRSGAMLARAMALFLRVISGEPGSSEEQEALCRAALPFEEERADPRRLALLWSVIAYSAQWRSRTIDDDQIKFALRDRDLSRRGLQQPLHGWHATLISTRSVRQNAASGPSQASAPADPS